MTGSEPQSELDKGFYSHRLLFNIFVERIMTDALENQRTVSIGGRTITNLRFANDIDSLTELKRGGTNLPGGSPGQDLCSLWHGN